MSISQDFYRHAKTLIPGGTQLLSKRPEQFCPEQWPNYAVKAKGCEVWDLDGKHYYDMTSTGIGSCLLGFADPDVSKAVITRIENGSMSTLNAPEEVHLAEKLIEIHPWAEQARFARCGGEACAISVRIARATTGRDIVAICGYHGWADCYIAVNLGETADMRGKVLDGMCPDGVPEALRATTVGFNFDSFEEFDRIISQYGDRLACVIVETARSSDPAPGFMEHIRKETKRVGAIMIMDEITVGWRNNYGGYHLKLGVTPDMAIYGKCLGNGHPISAVIGTKAAMEGAKRAFISSTYWTESVGPTAALVALEEMERTRVWEHVWNAGQEVTDVWKNLGKKHGLPIHTGDCFPTLNHFHFTEHTMQLKTLFTRLMLPQGFLANTQYYPTLAHNSEITAKYAAAVDIVFAQISDVLRKGDLEKVMIETCEADFGRLVR